MPKKDKGKVTKNTKLKASSWMRNVGKGLGMTSVDIIKEMMPASFTIIEKNADTMKSIYDSMRNIGQKTNDTREDTMFNRTLSKQIDNVKFGMSQFKSQLKSGDFVQEMREEDVSFDFSEDEGFGFDADGDDEYSFNMDDDMSDNDFVDSEENDDGDTIINVKPNVIVNSNINGNNPMVQAVTNQTDVVVKMSEVEMEQNFNLSHTSMVLNKQIGDNLISGISTLNSNVGMLVQFNSDNMNMYIGSSVKYHEESLNILREISETLKGSKKEEERSSDEESTRTYYDIFDSTGAINLNKYGSNVKKNLQTFAENDIFISSLINMFEDVDSVRNMMTNPIQEFLVKPMIESAIPKIMKEAMVQIDLSIGSVVPAMIKKITGWKDVDDNPFLSTIGKIFGIESGVNDSLDMSNYNKDKVDFDGKTKKSITEVIPGYLAKILSTLSGQKAQVFDYEKGSFRDISEVKSDWTSSVQRNEESGYKYMREVKNNLEAFQFENKDELYKLQDSIDSLYRSITRSGELIRPEKYMKGDIETDDLAEILGGSLNQNQIELIRAAIMATDKGKIYRDFGMGSFKSRASVEEFAKRESEKQDSIYRTIANGLFNDSQMTELTTKEMTEDDFVDKGKHSIFRPRDKYGKDSLYYLRKTFELLVKGIRVFVKDGEPDHLSSFESGIERYNDNLRQRSGEYNSTINPTITPLTEDKLKQAEELGQTVIRHRSDISSDPKVLADQIANYNRIKRENEENKEVKGEGFFSKLKDTLSKPFDAVSNMMKNVADKIDDVFYRVIFGKGIDGEDGEGFTIEGFINKTLDKITSSFTNFFNYLKEKVYEPLKEALIGEHGLVTYLKNSWLFKKAIEMKDKSFNFLFGEKGEGDKRSGGLFSDTANEMGDMFNKFKSYFTGKDKDGKDTGGESVFGHIKSFTSSFKDSIKEYLFGKDGENKDKAKGILNQFKESLLGGLQNFSEAIFGPKMIDGKENKNHWDSSDFFEKFKEGLPKVLAVGILGAGAGLLAGGKLGLLGALFLPGGPIGGAIVGTAIGFLSQSEKFKNFMFGDKDPDGKRLGGLISKGTQDFFKRHKTALIGGGFLGAVKSIAFPNLFSQIGVLPSMIVGGPIGGALAGVASSLMYKSDVVQNFLFGDVGKDGNRIGGLLDKIKGSMNKDTKNAAGTIAVGGLGGLGIGTILSKFGLFGSIAFNPMIGAIAGVVAAIGLTSDKWSEMLFGEDRLDKEGNHFKKGGLFNRFGNMMNVEVIQPFKVKMMEWNHNFIDWFHKNVADNVENAMIPILEEFSRIGGRISELFSKVGKFLTNLPIVNLFKGIGEDIVDSVYTNIIKPVGHVLSTILDQFKNAVGAVASMPFKMLRKFGDMLYEKHIKDGIAYYREMAWENLKKTPLVSGVIIPAMEGFKKGVDTVFDYTKSGLKKIFGFTTKMIGKGIGLLVKGVAGAIALPFQVIAAPFKAIGAIKDLGKNIRNTRDYSSKQSALDSIKAKNRGEEENTFLGAAWDMIKLMLPGNIGTKDAAGMSDEGGGYLYKRPHDDNKITITTPDGTEQPAIELPNGDIVPVIEDPNTGRQVPARFNDKGQLEKDPDTKLDLRSPKEKKNDKDAQRAEDKANRDDLLNKTKEEFDSQRKLAQSLGYDNLDDGKSFKGIEKEMKRKYGDDFKNKSQFEIDQHYIQLGMQQTQEKIKTAAEKTNTLLGRIIDCIMEMLFPGSTDIKPLGPPKPDELVKRDNAINDARLQNEAEEAKKLEELKKRGLYAKPIPGQPLQEYVNNDAVDFKLAMDMNEVEEEKKAKDKELKDARISKQRALSSKNVSWVKSEAEKKSTAEKELTWKDKILNTLSGAKDKISEHSTMWSEIFGKKGLITMGIMLALPLITNFLKNFKLPTAGDIINNITNSTKKFFNKIFNGADNDARTDKDGAGIANTDLHEVKWRAAYYGAEKAGDKALKGAKYVGGKIKATKAAAKNFRLSNVNRKLFSKLNKLQINNIDDMVNNHGVHMPEQVKELGIKNINELERLGVTSADDLAKIGINSYKDFEVLGIKPNAKDLSKLGIKDPDDLFKLVNPNAVVKPTLINKAKGAWNTTAARLQKGSDYTKGIRSYNKDLDAKAASIIDGLKSHGYDGKIKYNKKAGVVVAGSKQFDVGKRIKSQSDISDIKRNIKLKKSTVVDSEVKVGRKGIISKFIDLAKNTLGHMIEFIGKHFPNSSGLVSKLMKSTSSLLANLVESKLGKWTAKIVAGMGKTLGLAIPVAGLVINGAFVIWGGITGALEASRLFKIDPSSVDGLMRTISGIMKGVLNVGPAFVVEILNELSIEFLNKDVLSYIATQLYMLLANDVDDAKLQQAQSDMDVEVAAYNEEHGTNMSKDAYIDMTQKTVTQKVGDKFNEIGQGIFGKEKTVKNAQGVTVVARDAHGNIIRENQNIFQKGISAYGNLTKAVYGNWGSKQIYQTDENGVALMDEAGNYIQAKNTEGLTPEEIRKRYGMFAYADNDGNIRSKGKMNVIGEALGIAGDDEIRRRIGKTADQKVHMSDRVRNFAGNVFGNTLGRIVGVNSEQATQVMAGIQKVTGDLLNRIGSEITKAVTSMAQSLWEMPGKVIKNIAGLGEATVTYGEGKYCKVKEFPSVFIGGVVEAFSNLGKGISFLARSVKKGMDIAYAHEYDFGGFKFSLKGIGDGFNAFFSNIGEKIAGIFNFVGEIINKFWESDAGKTLKKAGEVVGAGVNNFKAGVNVISSGINNLTQGDQGVLENLRKTGSQFGSHVGGPGIGGPTMDLYDKKKSFNSARGWRMLNGKQNYHAGIDIGYGGVHPIIKSFTEGTVLGSTNEPAYGNHVVIRDKYGYGHLYGHLDSVNVKKGDTVGVGDVIGREGNTGNSYGQHLHYEVRKDPMTYRTDVDPIKYLKNYDSGIKPEDVGTGEAKAASVSTTDASDKLAESTSGLTSIVNILNDELAKYIGTKGDSVDGTVTGSMASRMVDGNMADDAKYGKIKNHDLSKFKKISGAEMDKWIKSENPKSTFVGKGQYFVDAGEKYQLDPRFLLSLAALESGWGNSEMHRKKSNYFSINMTDSNPDGGYDYGTQMGPGIMEAAKFIARDYVHSKKYKQNTLSKMHRPGGKYKNHFYASSSEWANTIAKIYSTAPGVGGPEMDIKGLQMHDHIGGIKGVEPKRKLMINNTKNTNMKTDTTIIESMLDKIVDVLNTIASNTGSSSETLKSISRLNTPSKQPTTQKKERPKPQPTPMQTIMDTVNKNKSSDKYRKAKMIAQGV